MIKKNGWPMIAVAVILVLSAALFAGGVVSGQKADPSGQAFSLVDGVMTPVSQGTVIATGKLTASGTCQMPKFTVGGTGDDNRPHGSILVQFTADCRAVVSDIIFDQNTMPLELEPNTKFVEPVIVPPTTERMEQEPQYLLTSVYRGTARAANDDIAGIDVTHVDAQMSYYDDGSQVYGGYNPSNSWTAAWYFNNLGFGAEWWPYGTSSVYNASNGSFNMPSWPGGYPYLWHWMETTFTGTPGDYSFTCSFSGDHIPAGYFECGGSRQ